MASLKPRLRSVCRQAIAGRYPVSAGSERTIQLEDFGQFFGYGGAVDTFFNTHLKQYVDSTSSPWKARATGNVPIELSAAALVAFENADTIKRTFFRQGSMQPSISFEPVVSAMKRLSAGRRVHARTTMRLHGSA